ADPSRLESAAVPGLPVHLVGSAPGAAGRQGRSAAALCRGPGAALGGCRAHARDPLADQWADRAGVTPALSLPFCPSPPDPLSNAGPAETLAARTRVASSSSRSGYQLIGRIQCAQVHFDFVAAAGEHRGAAARAEDAAGVVAGFAFNVHRALGKDRRG